MSMNHHLVLALLAAGTLPAAGQNPINYGPDLAANRFGQKLIELYSGRISWTWVAGGGTEGTEATLGLGVLTCVVTYTSPETGILRAVGPGLIDISVGLEPDDENPAARPGGKLYTIRAACPHPRSPPPHTAKWSHSFDTYKRKCGDFDSKGSRNPLDWDSPKVFRGTWTESTGDQEVMSMTWHLCRLPDPCAPLPQPDSTKPPPPDPCQ